MMRWLDGITDSCGHEFEQALEDGEGQGSLAYCSPQDCKELDTTEQLNNNNLVIFIPAPKQMSQSQSCGCKEQNIYFRGHENGQECPSAETMAGKSGCQCSFSFNILLQLQKNLTCKLNQNEKIPNAPKMFPSPSPFAHNSLFPSVLPLAAFPSHLYSLLSFLSQDTVAGLLYFKYIGFTQVNQIHSRPFQGSQISGEEKKFIITTQLYKIPSHTGHRITISLLQMKKLMLKKVK